MCVCVERKRVCERERRRERDSERVHVDMCFFFVEWYFFFGVFQ